jgi:hypothetical protein
MMTKQCGQSDDCVAELAHIAVLNGNLDVVDSYDLREGGSISKRGRFLRRDEPFGGVRRRQQPEVWELSANDRLSLDAYQSFASGPEVRPRSLDAASRPPRAGVAAMLAKTLALATLFCASRCPGLDDAAGTAASSSSSLCA